MDVFPKIFNDPQLHLNYGSLPRLSFKRPGWVYKIVKRGIDWVIAMLFIILFSPLILVISVFIWIKTKRRPIIKLRRVGYGGREFGMYKFMTMRGKVREAKSPRGIDDPRIYSWGKWLRRMSLDELPQLINVLKGEMSLVGPRPEMPGEVAKYRAWQRMRLDVKPGLTGLWQILGRKDLPLSQNLQYDLYYVASRSLWFDLWILIRTPWVVLMGKGAY
ncbi:MAG: sugar transferase [bacterium]|nr:sugar transferase [bacterium]